MNMEIIATVWKHPLNLDHVAEMIEAGATILRVKDTHGEPAHAVMAVQGLQQFICEKKLPVSILFDLPEKKVRLGGLNPKKQPVVPNRTYRVVSQDESASVDECIPIRFTELDQYFSPGERICIGDGELQAVIEDVEEREMRIRFLQGGILCQYRGVSTSRLLEHLDHIGAACEAILGMSDMQPDYVAVSFVSSADDIRRVRSALMQRFGGTKQPKLMAKIESQAGLDHAEEIMNAADMVVIGRGDLALTTDFTKMILEQKRLCCLGRELGKTVIVATQILDSCLTNYIPTRGDLADVTNIVLDGAGGVWFSQATAHNEHPGQPIRLFNDIAAHVMKNL